MNKPLAQWTDVEIKAGIYDRQNEIAILQNELRDRANRPPVDVKKVAEKVIEENKVESK